MHVRLLVLGAATCLWLFLTSISQTPMLVFTVLAIFLATLAVSLGRPHKLVARTAAPGKVVAQGRGSSDATARTNSLLQIPWRFVMGAAGSVACGRMLGLAASGVVAFALAHAAYLTANDWVFQGVLDDLAERLEESKAGAYRSDGRVGSTDGDFNYAPQLETTRVTLTKAPTVSISGASDSVTAAFPYSTTAKPESEPDRRRCLGRYVLSVPRRAPALADSPQIPARAPSSAPPPHPAVPATASPPPTAAESESEASGSTYPSSVFLIVEAIEVATTDSLEIRLEAAYQHQGVRPINGSLADAEMRRVEWWKGRADSNAILRIQRQTGPWPVVATEFPTTINAFAAYLEEQFLTEARLLNPDYRNHLQFKKIDARSFSAGGVFPLKRALTNDFAATIDSPWCRLLLLYAQHIQFICFVLWMTFAVSLLCRQLLFVRLEQTALILHRNGGWILKESVFEKALARRRGGVSGGEAAAAAWRWPQEHAGHLDQLLACVSLSGYIGTLYFLAISFPEASNLISSSRATMISSLSRFTLLMAGAFTTSLWSSVWFQLGSWLKTVQVTAETRQMLITEDSLK